MLGGEEGGDSDDDRDVLKGSGEEGVGGSDLELDEEAEAERQRLEMPGLPTTIAKGGSEERPVRYQKPKRLNTFPDSRPCQVCNDGRIYLESFHPL